MPTSVNLSRISDMKIYYDGNCLGTVSSISSSMVYIGATKRYKKKSNRRKRHKRKLKKHKA